MSGPKTCPKCARGDMGAPRYVRAQADVYYFSECACGRRAPEMIREHLHRTCDVCGYVSGEPCAPEPQTVAATPAQGEKGRP